MIGIVDHKFLGKYRRHAIVVNTIIAAIITPTGDPFNLALMAVPMMLCYELGVLGSWLFRKKDPARLTG
jgi:sec-independent protein translocase protein TatC